LYLNHLVYILKYDPLSLNSQLSPSEVRNSQQLENKRSMNWGPCERY